MNQIIAATFDIADQECKMYNALEWHNFIADTREQSDNDASLEDLFDEVYGDEFWWEVMSGARRVLVYASHLTCAQSHLLSATAITSAKWSWKWLGHLVAKKKSFGLNDKKVLDFLPLSSIITILNRNTNKFLGEILWT